MTPKRTQRTAEAGNSDPKVRSDCYVKVSLKGSGGIRIELTSKVKPMYGRQIGELVKKQLLSYGLENVWIEITDRGALDFVIMARIEAAVAQLVELPESFLPEMLPANTSCTTKDRFRISRLYLPGNNPALMINAGIHKPDGVILDLEDSVAPEKKDEARLLVRNALRAIDFYGAERMVRINPLPLGVEDLKAILPQNPHLLLIPKAESSGQIADIAKLITEYEQNNQSHEKVLLMPIIESALGVENAYSIATASDRIVAMAIGLEDLTADLGVRRTREGQESLWARSRLVNACAAAGIQAIDSVFSDVADSEGLREAVARSKAMGFSGMGCIHPRQIKIIHKGFSPSGEEISRSLKIKEAFDEAREKGLGVVSLGSKMIDPPVVKRALQTLKLAELMGLIK